MTSCENEVIIPNWFRILVCGTPLVALLVATIGAAWGSAINPLIFAGLTALSWRVITKVLGIPASAVVINLPARASLEPEISQMRKAS